MTKNIVIPIPRKSRDRRPKKQTVRIIYYRGLDSQAINPNGKIKPFSANGIRTVVYSLTPKIKLSRRQRYDPFEMSGHSDFSHSGSPKSRLANSEPVYTV
ncbi:hypothetical protein B5X24_HaOG209094 [Helicoverpa armigera]|nr:hypothetical protein B5X24_HaOG209094 [Helicoverpa armigera]